MDPLGKRHNGYSIVDREVMTIIESGLLPNNWLAQTCELFVLNQALKHLKDKEVTIYIQNMHLVWSTPLEKSGWNQA
jgi:hypothetical protein